MARIGRPPLGSRIVDSLEGSEHAKERLRAILETVEGRQIAELCERLGVERAYFNRLRTSTLQTALESLEPKTPGPKPKSTDPRDARIAALEDELRGVRLELDALRVRAALGITLPGVLKKTTR
jgi:hypothetical protein